MWNALRFVVGLVMLVAGIVGMAISLFGCGGGAALPALCANNADCHAGRCVYPAPQGTGRCVELVNGQPLCGGSLYACCDDGSCIAGHRCERGVCEAVR